MEECMLSPTKVHKFVTWSLEWSKCKRCGEIKETDKLANNKKKTNEK